MTHAVLRLMVLALLLGGVGQARAGYITLDPPGSTLTWAAGVSGNNVVGFYSDSNGTHGFLYNGSTYTTLNVPGATSTMAEAVSGNNVAGQYSVGGSTYGFVYNGSTYTTPPQPSPTPSGQEVLGIDGNNVVGAYSYRTGHGHQSRDEAYLDTYNGSTSTSTLITPPGATSSTADGISGSNVVGYYTDTSNQTHGFLYNGSTYTTLDPPGSTFTQALAVSGNNAVGTYNDSNDVGHGFLYNGSIYTTLNPPGSRYTVALAVSGNLVGGFYLPTTNPPGVDYGFLYNGSTYTTVNPPGSTSSQVNGISGNNVVGVYINGDGVLDGFLFQSVPEPASLTLFAIGAAGLLGFGSRRRQGDLRRPNRVSR